MTPARDRPRRTCPSQPPRVRTRRDGWRRAGSRRARGSAPCGPVSPRARAGGRPAGTGARRAGRHAPARPPGRRGRARATPSGRTVRAGAVPPSRRRPARPRAERRARGGRAPCRRSAPCAAARRTRRRPRPEAGRAGTGPAGSARGGPPWRGTGSRTGPRRGRIRRSGRAGEARRAGASRVRRCALAATRRKRRSAICGRRNRLWTTVWRRRTRPVLLSSSRGGPDVDHADPDGAVSPDTRAPTPRPLRGSPGSRALPSRATPRSHRPRP